MCSILPFRKRPVSESVRDTYHDGWRDGCKYGERLARWKGRVEGTFGGLLIACAVIALAFYVAAR